MKFDLTKYETKKSSIIDAAFKCIYVKGISGITMRSIAKEAKINQATLHYYFGGKENLLTEVMQVLFNRFFYDIKRHFKATDPPIKKFEGFIKSGMTYIGKQKHLFVVFMEFWAYSIRKPDMQEMFSRLYDKIYDVCESILEEGIQQGVFRDIQKEAIARVIVSYVEGAGIQWHMHNHSFDLGKHFELLTVNLKNSVLKKPE